MNMKKIRLSVEDDQKAAFSLYLKVGFEITGKENKQRSIIELNIN